MALLATPAEAALWFLPLAAPIGLWVAWSDMKHMKIPNRAVIALVGVFAVVGPFVLPLHDWGWRWMHLVAVLVAGFAMNMAGLIGAGDAKFAAAMAPFIALGDVTILMTLFAATLLVTYIAHRTFRAIPPLRSVTADWESWQRKDFPMGLALGLTLILYLLLAAIYGA